MISRRSMVSFPRQPPDLIQRSSNSWEKPSISCPVLPGGTRKSFSIDLKMTEVVGYGWCFWNEILHSLRCSVGEWEKEATRWSQDWACTALCRQGDWRNCIKSKICVVRMSNACLVVVEALGGRHAEAVGAVSKLARQLASHTGREAEETSTHLKINSRVFLK